MFMQTLMEPALYLVVYGSFYIVFHSYTCSSQSIYFILNWVLQSSGLSPAKFECRQS